MANLIQAIRGMNDILPHETPRWRLLETTLLRSLEQYGYEEIRFPLVESTQLFKRSIGEATDIVEKEMYTFTDLNGDSLTLRPEGTAGCVRACLQHSLLYNQQQKLWYVGPMYRHEKPQKGRYRQFHQFGVEAFGIPGVDIEVELIAFFTRVLQQLNIAGSVILQLNTLGSSEERKQYREKLVSYLTANKDALDADSVRRIEKNPLRVLDSKDVQTQRILENAPKMFDCLGEESKKRFQQLCEKLDALHIAYQVNTHLVRGLDYYGQTVFEWVTDKLGSQATVCGGGRYDILVEQMGGAPTPAVGLAMGIERLLLLLETLQAQQPITQPFSVFLMSDHVESLSDILVLAEKLRNYNSKWRILTHLSAASFKSLFKKADKSGADVAIIIGEEERIQRKYSAKLLRKESAQSMMTESELLEFLNSSDLKVPGKA